MPEGGPGCHRRLLCHRGPRAGDAFHLQLCLLFPFRFAARVAERPGPFLLWEWSSSPLVLPLIVDAPLVASFLRPRVLQPFLQEADPPLCQTDSPPSIWHLLFFGWAGSGYVWVWAGGFLLPAEGTLMVVCCLLPPVSQHSHVSSSSTSSEESTPPKRGVQFLKLHKIASSSSMNK